MPPKNDTRTFRNDQLVLQVSKTVDPQKWEENRYERFFDALCSTREYQKDSLRTTLRYLLGGSYVNLRALAEENFASSEVIQERYGSFESMESRLLLPDRLYGSVDLATGTGKSYLMFGLAMVLLAEGTVDRVLVLCPSNTIEAGLIEKFSALAADPDLYEALPADSKIRAPRIIRADQTIAEGCICVENYHAVLKHVRSSVRDSLSGRGSNVLVLNDEVHHVVTGKKDEAGKWKQFLESEEFGFNRIVGVSGTCYSDNDYFADVISRYSLKQAIEENVVKRVRYVTEEDIGNDSSERLQIIYENHRRNKELYRLVKPMTILVARDIPSCEEVASEWIDFLVEHEGIDPRAAADKVLVVTSAPRHAPNLAKLANVDSKASPVEWIMSVAMLTEGWDVKNVFQIVPHEERAFNSKLLIAQVLGRGLRVPPEYAGQRPQVTVFNHDSWSSRIRHLVLEILEIEKTISSRVASASPYHFDLHQIDYTREPETKIFVQSGEYDLLEKGYVFLPSQASSIAREIEYEDASTSVRTQSKTTITKKMHPLEQVAAHVYEKLRSIDLETAEQVDEDQRTGYAQKHDLDWCREMIRESLRRAGETAEVVSEENRQKILQSLGPLSRGASKTVRYQLRPSLVRPLTTLDRQPNSVSMNSLRQGDLTLFYGPNSLATFLGEDLSNFRDAIGEDSDLPRKAVHEVTNAFLFRTPLNVVIADHDPERKFVRKLVETENATALDAWIKSTDRQFYPIDFSWKKGEHTKRGSFNPDFFLKKGSTIYVVEIKDDGQVAEPSEENKKKAEFARDHFDRLNLEQDSIRYQFNFLTPMDFEVFFPKLRAGELDGYQSHLDVALRS